MSIAKVRNNHQLCRLGILALAATWACQPVQAPGTSAGSVAEPPPGATWEGEAFTFHKIRDDIYHAVGTGNLTVGCNGSVIINENDVLLVDSHMTPAASWALMKELENLTDKPVRYVVNTHFHFDHAHGNQAFGDDVEIIGHKYTREQLVAGASKEGRAWEMFVVDGLPARIQQAESALETAIDATDADAEAEARKQLAVHTNYRDATAAIVPTPPTMTLAKQMTLTRGGREIQLWFFGRGHTGGDVVVYLPEEKVIVTGDLVTSGISYMGNAYLSEWADTLDAVKELDFARPRRRLRGERENRTLPSLHPRPVDAYCREARVRRQRGRGGENHRPIEPRRALPSNRGARRPPARGRAWLRTSRRRRTIVAAASTHHPAERPGGLLAHIGFFVPRRGS